MSLESAVIAIKAEARTNAMFLTVLGSTALLLCLLAAKFWWNDYRLVLVLLILVSFITLLIGVFKHFEPHHSFVLTPDTLYHHHRYGSWQIQWHNIMIVDQPRVTQGLETLDLAYIGIKLRDFDAISQVISPRMANRLLHEQRDLYLLSCQLEAVSMLSGLLNDKPYKTASGKKVTGPIAAWMHRSQMLQQSFGYHLYIPLNACDRSPGEFVSLLKQCKETAEQYARVQPPASTDTLASQDQTI